MSRKRSWLGLLLVGLTPWLHAQEERVLMPEDLFQRNIGTREQMNTRFPPHRIIGNVYYVGTHSLSSFLVATSEGHVLINTSFEATVPAIRESVEELGFRFEDIAIVLGSHAHGDHMQGDALVQEMTGAQVMVMAEEVPLAETLTPGGKPHPIDRVLQDGEAVTLGGTSLIAHLTPGHTRGCTSWGLEVEEDGRTYDVMIICSVGVNPNFQLYDNPDVPTIADEYRSSFARLRSRPADVPLGAHPAMYDMEAKYARLGGAPNPFIDPEGYLREIELNERAFTARYEEQRRAAAER